MRGVRLVPYRLPAVLEATAEGGCWVVEGERDADTLAHAGLVATCNSGGAGKWRDEYAAYLRGASEVVIVADRDPAGYRHALDVARSLDGTTVVRVALAAEGCKDVSDHLAAGHALGELVAFSQTELEDLASAATSTDKGLRTRGVIEERVRPLRWLWARRIPMGVPSLLVGEEGVGKGTLAAWIIARATRGELDGDLRGEPRRVLVIGDEDAFEPVWVPRLYAAGADLAMLRTLDDGEYLDDLGQRADDLAAAIRRDEIGLVLLDQVLDHVPGGDAGQGVYNPKNVRQALLPLRRVAGARDRRARALHPSRAGPGRSASCSPVATSSTP